MIRAAHRARSLSIGVLAGLIALGVARLARAEAPLQRFAIVIGNNRSENPSAETLHYADDDAVRTEQLLEEAGVDSQLLVTLDEDSKRFYANLGAHVPARRAELDRALDTTFAKIRRAAARGVTTEFLFFYSGHGDVDRGEGYVQLEDERLTRSALREILVRSPATRNHVVVDACKSYFLAFERGPGGKRSAHSASFADAAEPGRLDNVGFVLSTSSDRESHEWERYQAGILSHELLSALRGAADADRDGRVSYAELGAFLLAANRNIDNPRFRPDFLVRPPRREPSPALLSWPAGSEKLVLDSTGLGHVYVETASGERLLDAHPARALTLSLHVPATRPLFVRRNDESAELVVASNEREHVASLRPVTSPVAAKGSLSLALEQLFATPFGPSDVNEFARRPVPVDAPDTLATHDWDAPRVTRWIAGPLALAGVVGGASFNVIAYGRYRAGAGESQLEIASRNHSVHQLNTAAFVCYGVAGVSGLVWGSTFFWPDSGLSVSPNLASDERGWMLGYARPF